MMNIFYVLFFASTSFGLYTSKPCQRKKFDAGYVCVCTNDYCDTLDVPELSNDDEWLLVTSTESGQRFNFSVGTFNFNQHINPSVTFVDINQNAVHHEIIGFGGAITGAVSYIINKLSTNLRECIYKSYYTKDIGLGYTMMRIPIGGCDFDLEPWVYNELPENDLKLSNFTKLHPIDLLRTQLIKDLMNATKNFDIKIMGATWSPPRWMKEKRDWPGKNDNRLKVEYYQTWADYHLKWLNLMETAEIPIYAISTGNEPYFAHRTPFMGLSWNASSLAIWIAHHFGPTLKNSKHSTVQIHTFDDNRNVLQFWLNEMNDASKDAFNYISAIDVHGYSDRFTSPTILDATKAQFSNLSILYTEMCFGITGPISTSGPTLGCFSHFYY